MKLTGDDTIFVKKGHDENNPFEFKRAEYQVIDEPNTIVRVGSSMGK